MSRRLAREIAMQTLFAVDLGHELPEEMLALLGGQKSLSAPGTVFSKQLVEGVLTRLVLLDKIIKKYALEWDLERLAAIDRNLLRMALFEMIFLPEIPPAVVINEVLEIAKIYSSSEAPRFINGILGKIIMDLELIRTEQNIGN